MHRLSVFWQHHKKVLVYIVALFIVTRIIISLIGITTFTYLYKPNQMAPWRREIATEHPKLVLWTIWDSDRYMKVAEHGYIVTKPFRSDVQQNIGFFPLYPMVIAPLGKLLGDYAIAGMIISNICFLAASFMLYLLAKLDLDEAGAKRVLLYLFVFPTAYIFSAVYSESLLLLLVLTCLYAARKEHWLLAGILGYFAALTKPIGFLVMIPVVLIYLSNRNYDWRKIRSNSVFIFLIPLGLLSFALYNYHLTGDLLAYAHVQQVAWHHSFSNPLILLWKSLWTSINARINSIGMMVALVIFILGFRKISFAYWAYGLSLVLFPLFTGNVFGSMRY
ncbi:MAG: hypothetical protein K0S38_1101, partial [Candidatus Paceibacter sp.]|nr:hypothetical protein [Candidatus Paceibacter sp.]